MMLLLELFALTMLAEGLSVPQLDAFSAMAAGQPQGAWSMQSLRGRAPAQFRIADASGRNVLEAEADSAAAGLAHPLAPIAADGLSVEWQWRIEQHLAGTDMTTRAGDDFPARVYLTFARDRAELPWATRMKLGIARLLYGQDVPAAALCYVWDPELPAGTVRPNAYSDTVSMVVVRSGPATGAWESETRDIAQDYRAAFGTEPPLLTGVILAIDSDDGGGRARSWFGDVRFRHGPARPDPAN